MKDGTRAGRFLGATLANGKVILRSEAGDENEERWKPSRRLRAHPTEPRTRLEDFNFDLSRQKYVVSAFRRTW